MVIRNHGAGIIRHREDYSSVFVRKILLMRNPCLLCHTVHDYFYFHGLELSCQLCLHSSSNFTIQVD